MLPVLGMPVQLIQHNLKLSVSHSLPSQNTVITILSQLLVGGVKLIFTIEAVDAILALSCGAPLRHLFHLYVGAQPSAH